MYCLNLNLINNDVCNKYLLHLYLKYIQWKQVKLNKKHAKETSLQIFFASNLEQVKFWKQKENHFSKKILEHLTRHLLFPLTVPECEEVVGTSEKKVPLNFPNFFFF